MADADNNIAMLLCSSPKYLQCLKMTKKSCNQTYKVASENCYSFHDVENIDYDGDIEVFKESSKCVVTEFFKYNAIQKQEYEKCDHILQAHLQIYIEKARIQSKGNDKKFFEEDDHLHNYNN